MNKDLGQLDLQALLGPVKARVSSRFLPDFTIDLSKPAKPSGLMAMLKPEITFLIAGNAYKLEYGSTTPKKTDVSIFQKPTLIDQLNEIGLLPLAIFAGAIIFTGIKLIRS